VGRFDDRALERAVTPVVPRRRRRVRYAPDPGIAEVRDPREAEAPLETLPRQMGALRGRRGPDRIHASRLDAPGRGSLRLPRPRQISVRDEEPRLKLPQCLKRARVAPALPPLDRHAPAREEPEQTMGRHPARADHFGRIGDLLEERGIEDPVVGIARGHDSRGPAQRVQVADELQGTLAPAAADRREEVGEDEEPFQAGSPRSAPFRPAAVTAIARSRSSVSASVSSNLAPEATAARARSAMAPAAAASRAISANAQATAS